MKYFKALLYSLVFSFSLFADCMQSPIDGEYYESNTTPFSSGGTISGAPCGLTPNTIYYSTLNGYYKGEFFKFVRQMGCSNGVEQLRDVTYYHKVSCIPAPSCPEGQILDTTSGLCVPLSENNDTASSTVQSLDEDFYSETGCPTATQNNDYVPVSISNTPDSNETVVGRIAPVGSVPADCSGFIWKCNYATKLFEKITFRVQDNFCMNDREFYTGNYSNTTSEDKQKESNPCDTKLKTMQAICKDGVIGDCLHNGMFITVDHLECKDAVAVSTASKELECSQLWYERYNATTNTCDCEDGYTRNKWGDCWKDLDPLAKVLLSGGSERR